MSFSSKSVTQSLAAIEALELGPIMLKLMDREDGQGWSRSYAGKMAAAYKRYLTLLVKYPEESIAPTKDVDKFWHAHILDTQKYAADCQEVFGYFLHHFPYFGMRGAEDAAALSAAAENMNDIYQREFGESLPRAGAWCTAAKQASAWCTAAIKATAWCTAAAKKSAWCTAASAWCTAAAPLGKKPVDVVTRPSL